MAEKTATSYKVLAGCNTSDDQRFEIGDVFRAADIPKDSLAALLEMKAIEPVVVTAKKAVIEEA